MFGGPQGQRWYRTVTEERREERRRVARCIIASRCPGISAPDVHAAGSFAKTAGKLDSKATHRAYARASKRSPLHARHHAFIYTIARPRLFCACIQRSLPSPFFAVGLARAATQTNLLSFFSLRRLSFVRILTPLR